MFQRIRAGAIVVLSLLVLAPAVIAGDLPDYKHDANHTREQVPDVFKWDLTPLAASIEDWEAEVESIRGGIPKLHAFEGRLGEPKAMRECLAMYFDLHNRASHVQQYAALDLNTTLTDETKQARSQRSLTLMDEVMAAAGFMRGEILALDDGAMKRAYAAGDGPDEYRSYLDNLRRRASRVLHPEAERVLQLAGDNLWAEIDLNEIPTPYEDAFNGLLSDIAWPVVHDADGNEVQLTLSNYSGFRGSSNREVRREACTAFFATLRQYQHALTATLAGQFETDVFFSRARGYDTALEAYMDKDGLPVAVHDNLIGTINDNLKPLHRYVELRRKVLGLDELHYYDLYVPMVEAAEMDVPFEEALKILPESVKPLGKDYVELIKTSLDLENGWIDLYPSNDKESGAFSASVYGRHPWIKMNYQDTLDDMSTLTHEAGHALHSHLAMTKQPYHNYRYVPFMAEIASTCNEALLADYLLDRAEDDATKAGLIAAELESIRQTIYRQTFFSEFERRVHGYVEDGTPVTASLLDETYRELVQRYYGPHFSIDENDGMEWAYIPHFYFKYYVYSYATGLSSGLAIAERVKEQGDKAAEAYLDMLEGGCSAAPLDLLKAAGVDLTRPDAIESAMKRFDRRVTELAELLGVEI